MFTDLPEGQTKYDPADIEYRWAYEWDTTLLTSDELAWVAADNILMKISRRIRDKTFREIKYFIQANQNRDPFLYYSCTIHSNFGAIADLFSLTRETYEAGTLEITKRMEKKWWYNPWVGAYTINSAKESEAYWNEHNPDRQVELVVCEIWSALFWTLQSYWYSFAVTYISSQDYVNDAKDGTLDNVVFENARGWHSIRWKNLENLWRGKKPLGVTAIDNYFNPDRKDYKRYKIPRSHIAHLKNSSSNPTWRYFARCYTFIEKKYLV